MAMKSVLGMKSARFHGHEIHPWHEICQFHGHEIHRISWNPADFMNSGFSTTKSCIFHQNQYRWTRSTTECCIFGSFDSFQYRYMLNISPYHEICRISWNPSWNLPNFMKSARFHEIRHEIRRISWNSPNFMYFPNEPRTNGPIFSKIDKCSIVDQIYFHLKYRSLFMSNFCACC